MTQILSARWVIPVEPLTVLEHHAVVIERGNITAILPTPEARQQFPDATETVLAEHVLIPGLVNLHTHAAMTLMRGLADDTPLMTWLTDHIWPVESKHLSEAFVEAGTELACAEMLRSGTTCFADMYFYQDTAAKVVQTAGMRAALGGAVLEFPTPYAADADAYIARALASRDDFSADPKLKLMLTPHAPYTVSDATFQKLVMIANEMDDLLLMCHIHETANEPGESEKQYGVRAIERLERLGVLGPNLIAVHCVHLTPGEIQLFKERGVHVAHCPSSNLKLASGIAPIKAMVDAGINVGIGTDGCASSNRLDMFAETRLATLLQKGVSGDAAALPALQALQMATLNGAKALQWDRVIGSLKPGKAADIVAVDLGSIETTPCYDPASHLWHAAGREHVTHVWVDGELLVDNRALTTLDIDAIRAKSATWGERFRVH
ncbi:MAG: TRZ/ATZ family hydrolase [Aeromicrobium sp.]|nr:TRZ/ATZ family hydrolase [Burkholderiales bacterium]